MLCLGIGQIKVLIQHNVALARSVRVQTFRIVGIFQTVKNLEKYWINLQRQGRLFQMMLSVLVMVGRENRGIFHKRFEVQGKIGFQADYDVDDQQDDWGVNDELGYVGGCEVLAPDKMEKSAGSHAY